MKTPSPTILEIVKKGTAYLTKHDIESPRLNIELIICKALNCTRIDIYSKFDKPMLDSEVNLIREMMTKRAKHFPLQYLLEETDFLGLKLFIDQNVLIPRPETEQMAQSVISRLKNLNIPDPKVLDIGTGSGCIALAIAKALPEARVFACDISESAIEIAKTNAKHNGIDNVTFGRIDIINQLPKEKNFDLIVSNPPYISEVDYSQLAPELFSEPKTALSDEDDGMKFYRRFAEVFPTMLKPSGIAYLEFGMGQHQTISGYFSNPFWQTEIINDFADIPRFIVAKITT